MIILSEMSVGPMLDGYSKFDVVFVLFLFMFVPNACDVMIAKTVHGSSSRISNGQIARGYYISTATRR